MVAISHHFVYKFTRRTMSYYKLLFLHAWHSNRRGREARPSSGRLSPNIHPSEAGEDHAVVHPSSVCTLGQRCRPRNVSKARDMIRLK